MSYSFNYAFGGKAKETGYTVLTVLLKRQAISDNFKTLLTF